MNLEEKLNKKRKLIEAHIGHEAFEKVLADLDKNREVTCLLPVVIGDIASYYRLANRLPEE